MTTAEKLKAIVEAQADGGYIAYAPFFDGREVEYQHGVLTDVAANFSMMVLPILLDPQGLRAAYKYNGQCVICTRYKLFPNPSLSLASSMHGCIGMKEKDAAHMILDTWLSSDGDAAQTIDTAFNLLPNEIRPD